jgi:hypothetical protein
MATVWAFTPFGETMAVRWSRVVLVLLVPFWFFRIKAPAADFALEGTGLSFQRLGITADELRRYGSSSRDRSPNHGGGRLLVWTE